MTARRPLRIAQVSSELAPFAKTGGLGDVCGALPRYLTAAGCHVMPFLPLYGNLKEGWGRLKKVAGVEDVPVRLGSRTYRFTLWTAPLPGTPAPVYFVRCAALFDRHATYSGEGDEHVRFAFLTKAAIESCQRLAFAPDIFHFHDWHTALGPLFLNTQYQWDRARFGRTKTVLTIHNVGYQGVIPAERVKDLGLDPVASLLHQDDLAAGRFSFLMHGVLYANALTTVSKTHAQEMLTPEHGMGLDHWLRARRKDFVGIVNGIDTSIWSPEADRMIARPYSASDLSGKSECRQALLEGMNLAPAAKGPVFAVLSRLTVQKGLELVLDAMPRVLSATDSRLVVVGKGETRYADAFHALARRFPRKVAFRHDYDEPTAHRVESGADAFLMPSRFEPCGLNQMYSMRYGTPPIVRRTGGLADTVKPFHGRAGHGTGFLFTDFSGDALEKAVAEALHAFGDTRAWHRLMANGMAEDWSWEHQIKEYLSLYGRLLAH